MNKRLAMLALVLGALVFCSSGCVVRTGPARRGQTVSHPHRHTHYHCHKRGHGHGAKVCHTHPHGPGHHGG